MLEHLATPVGPYTVTQPVTAQAAWLGKIWNQRKQTFPPYLVSLYWFRQGFQVTIENDWPVITSAGLVNSLRVSVGHIGIQEVFTVCQAASACILILNCGMQSVTAICLSSHISLSFRLSEIEIDKNNFTRWVNRGIGIGMLFEFKLNIVLSISVCAMFYAVEHGSFLS